MSETAHEGFSGDLLPSDPGQAITSIAHFYRGELTRMVAWRDRLDHTTNWAIAASAAMLSVTLSSPDSHHAVILCCMALVFLLLLIEARRFRYYDVSRYRIRLLERNYHARLFAPESRTDPPDWKMRLHENLRTPQFQHTLLQAMRNRLRRNYVWIYLTLFVAWWLKVSTIVLEPRTGKARFVHSIDHFFANAAVSYIPGEIVVSGVALFLASLVYIATAAPAPGFGDEADV